MAKYPDLEALFGVATVQAATMVAKEQAKAYPEGYVAEGFEPHKWVVAAVCHGIYLGNQLYRLKGMNGVSG